MVITGTQSQQGDVHLTRSWQLIQPCKMTRRQYVLHIFDCFGLEGLMKLGLVEEYRRIIERSRI